MSDDIQLDNYIAAFIRNSERALKNGQIQIIELWAEGCGHCKSQYKYWMRPLSHTAGGEGMGIDIFEYNKYIDVLDLFGGNEQMAWDIYQRSDIDTIAKKMTSIIRTENKTAGREIDNDAIRAKAERAAKKMIGAEQNPLTKGQMANIEMVANRILPIETTSPMGKKLILEAQIFADKIKTLNSPILKRPQDYEIRFTPTWLDFYTHENYGYGHHSERQLRDMLNLNSLSSRRERFKALHSQVMNQECDGVACGLDGRVKKVDPKQVR